MLILASLFHNWIVRGRYCGMHTWQCVNKGLPELLPCMQSPKKVFEPDPNQKIARLRISCDNYCTTVREIERLHRRRFKLHQVETSAEKKSPHGAFYNSLLYSPLVSFSS